MKAFRYTYDKLCDEKKTMIFTSSTETNQIYSELFSDKKVKTYDSKNNTPSERDGIIEWFKETPGAVLINTGCFTKGFDVCDVEAIMVARATKSLALWIQIVGRGARITEKQFKDRVIVVDGGNNIEEHGTFSFERNWYKIFEDRKIKNIIEETHECDECGYTFLKKDIICPNCGHEIPFIDVASEEEKEKKVYTINGKKIKHQTPVIDINFCINKGITDYEALKVLRQKWVNFLVKLEIEKPNFERAIKSGEFQRKFDKLLKPQYLIIIRSILKKGKNVVYKNYCDKIINESFKKKYEI
jgi:superfamily II DNA or RNA helicase